MACSKGVNLIEKSVEDLEKEITCAICHEHYTEPKVLPSCCHYYCKECILKLVLRTGVDRPFSCPECRKENELPQGDIDQLQTAAFVNRIKDVYFKLERAHGKEEAKCEMCSEGIAEAFCRKCKFICSECAKQHQRMKKMFEEHTVTPLNKLNINDMKEDRPLPKCPIHEELMKIFCFNCNCLVCRDCILYKHKDHRHKFVKEVSPEVREKVIEQLTAVKEVRENISKAITKTKYTKSEVEAQGQEIATKIKKSFEELHKILEKQEEKIKKEASSKVEKKLNELSSQEDRLSISLAAVESIIDYAGKCVDHSEDSEMLRMHAELINQMDMTIKEDRTLEPVEEVDLELKVNRDDFSKQSVSTVSLATLPIDPTKCTVEIIDPVRGHFTLIKRMINGKETRQKCSVEVHAKIGQRTVVFIPKHIGGNEYRISSSYGIHGLSILVNKKEVPGGPFL